jgi:hypothetical protein
MDSHRYIYYHFLAPYLWFHVSYTYQCQTYIPDELNSLSWLVWYPYKIVSDLKNIENKIPNIILNQKGTKALNNSLIAYFPKN